MVICFLQTQANVPKKKLETVRPQKNKTSADTNMFVELNNMLPCEQLKFNLPCISPHAQPTH